MPTKVVSAATMQVGKKGKGKHWTAAQVESRKKIAEGLKREINSPITPPAWLSAQALEIWRRKLEEVAGLKASEALLDVLDRETLALYCDANVQYIHIASKKNKKIDDVKAMQGWARLISACADKLGFNPTARARLVKKIAEDPNADQFGKEFDQ